MNVSEYIVYYLKKHGVKHFFGYQGTMISHFVDAICNTDNVMNHVCYNEQGASLAACGLAKLTGEVSVAYSTSGPGAINLMQGIADAYYDSAPVLFITGQLNYSEYTTNLSIRQQGFQQTDIVSICKSITKMAVQLTPQENIKSLLDKAFHYMLSGRKGPVLIDIPMDIQRKVVDIDVCLDTDVIVTERDKSFDVSTVKEAVKCIIEGLSSAKRPVFIIGNGIGKDIDNRNNIRKLINHYKVPTISTMLAKDLITFDNSYNFGVIGYAYGHRYANYIVNKKCDLIISLGARLCPRQVGNDSETFASNAKIIRIDCDSSELRSCVHSDEKSYCVDVNMVIKELLSIDSINDFTTWVSICKEIKRILTMVDKGKNYRLPNDVIAAISSLAPINADIVCDVGQHQIWTMQSFNNTENQRILFSGGLGAMGFALPAAIGAYYGNSSPVICLVGDGSLQMNIQELEWISYEKIPVFIIVLNNNSLGLIRQQQDGIFKKRHYGSTMEYGYGIPNFVEIAKAYGIPAIHFTAKQVIAKDERLKKILCESMCPALIEIQIDNNSYAYPKTIFGNEMHNQSPVLNDEICNILNQL